MLDLVLVLDSKDAISIYAKQVINALKNVSPSLKVQKRHYCDSRTTIRSRRILFFLTGDEARLADRVEGWANTIEYQFVHETSYFIVYLQTNEIPIDRGIVKDIVSVRDLTNLQSWWPRVVQFLFSVDNFTKTFDCYIENLSQDYNPAQKVHDTILELWSAFGLNKKTIGSVDIDLGVVVLRYTSRDDEWSIDRVENLKRTVKHLYVIGTCLNKEKSDRSPISLLSRSEILVCSLEVLVRLNVIEPGTLQKKDRGLTRYFGTHIEIARDSIPVRAFDVSRADRRRIPIEPPARSAGRCGGNMQCVLSMYVRCAVLLSVLLVLAIGAFIFGIVFLATRGDVENGVDGEDGEEDLTSIGFYGRFPIQVKYTEGNARGILAFSALYYYTSDTSSYNPNSGIFTAPVDGRYLFIAEVCHSVIGFYSYNITFPEWSVYLYSVLEEDIYCWRGTLVYPLTEGSSVYIQFYDSIYIENPSYLSRSYFTGYLISKD